MFRSTTIIFHTQPAKASRIRNLYLCGTRGAPDKMAHWEDVMPVTTKGVVFIAENMITSFNYASISKKVLKDLGKAMRASRRMPKNANLSAKDIGGFLINNIRNSSAVLADKGLICDYVAEFLDMYEEKL